MAESCVYCGTTENLTAEHAPPKLIFAEPRPSDLITVRACLTCNQAGQKDAEYFRWCLSVDPETEDTPGVAAIRPAVVRSLDRPQAQGFRAVMLASMKVDPPFLKIHVNTSRINETVRRIVRCLYVHEVGHRLPTTEYVGVVTPQRLERFRETTKEGFKQIVMRRLLRRPERRVAGGDFAYVFMHADKPFSSLWAVLFFRVHGYFVFTSEPRQKPAAE